jgi:hypothetical protein
VSYLTQNEIAANRAMYDRTAQAVAEQQVPDDPDRWTHDHRRYWAAAPGWAAAWEYARLTHPDDPDYDPGADEAVITDAQILAQVQTMLGEPVPAVPTQLPA